MDCRRKKQLYLKGYNFYCLYFSFVWTYITWVSKVLGGMQTKKKWSEWASYYFSLKNRIFLKIPQLIIRLKPLLTYCSEYLHTSFFLFLKCKVCIFCWCMLNTYLCYNLTLYYNIKSPLSIQILKIIDLSTTLLLV